MISGEGKEDIRPLPNLAKVQTKVKVWGFCEDCWSLCRQVTENLCYRFQMLSDDIHSWGLAETSDLLSYNILTGFMY